MSQETLTVEKDIAETIKRSAEAAGMSHSDYLAQLLNGPASEKRSVPDLPSFKCRLVYQGELYNPIIKAKDKEAAKEKLLKEYPGATIHNIL